MFHRSVETEDIDGRFLQCQTYRGRHRQHIVKAERNTVIHAKIGTDELAKVRHCTAEHIKAEEELLEKHSSKMAKCLQSNEGIWLLSRLLWFTIAVLAFFCIATVL